jgi:FKBP-type peptidyl-prolyl cis-trans isomerase SlyD
MQATAETVVSVDYTVSDDQGEILQSSKGSEPLTYVHGAGQIIPGLERALEGKSPGDSIEVTIPPEEAYGDRDPALVQSVPREQFPEGVLPQVGQQFQVQFPTGPRLVTVANVDDGTVQLDANHPLAGCVLNFDCTVKEVREATAEEKQRSAAR